MDKINTSQKTCDDLHGIEFAKAHCSKINADGHKEHKEAIYDFARGLNENEKTENEKSQKIKKLEKRLIRESDFAFIVANRIRKRNLNNITNNELYAFNESYQTRNKRLDSLAIIQGTAL